MKNGDTLDITDKQYSDLKKVIVKPFRERGEFFIIDSERTIRIDYIGYIIPEKEA
jgi:hypothetical protein